MANSKKLPYSEFMMRFGWDAYQRRPEEGGSMPPPRLEESIQQWTPEFRVLVEASKHNCPSAFSQFLQDWLLSVGVVPPEGVFKAISYGSGKGGRKEDPKAIGIYALWIALGEPSVTSTKLAKAYYKANYTAAEVDERKRMVDLVRRAVERVMERQLTVQPTKNRAPSDDSIGSAFRP
jgi:hypothetical protein